MNFLVDLRNGCCEVEPEELNKRGGGNRMSLIDGMYFELLDEIEKQKPSIKCNQHVPAADVAPVIRCANCKWFQCNRRGDGYLPEGVSEFECRHWCGPCDPTDYCSYGEPPKEEQK